MKYTSIAQFLIGVEGVQQEDLSQGDRLVLYILAHHADYHTGEAHPGNATLMFGAVVKTRQGINYIINRLRTRKLISMVSAGDGGRGLATIFKILIDDPRFPEPSKPKPASDSLQVSDVPAIGEAASNDAETRKRDDENPQATESKPASKEPETRKSELAHILKAILKSHPPTLQGEGGSPSKETAKTSTINFDWVDEYAGLMGALSDKHKKDLATLAKEHGQDTVKQSIGRFVDRPEGFTGLNKPWLMYFNQAPDLIRQVQADEAQRQRTAEMEEICWRQIVQETQARNKQMENWKPTGTVEDYMDDLK